MPLLVHAVLAAFGVHRQSVEHARLTHGEIRDVDHLLHLAVALRLDLAVFQGDETAERVLVDPQLVGQRSHRLAALGGGDPAPGARGLDRGGEHALVVGRRRAANPRQTFAGRGARRFDDRAGLQRAPTVTARPGAGVRFGEPESLQRFGNLRHGSLPFSNGRHSAASRPRAPQPQTPVPRTSPPLLPAPAGVCQHRVVCRSHPY